jgi:hypothetical protein
MLTLGGTWNEPSWTVWLARHGKDPACDARAASSSPPRRLTVSEARTARETLLHAVEPSVAGQVARESMILLKRSMSMRTKASMPPSRRGRSGPDALLQVQTVRNTP